MARQTREQTRLQTRERILKAARASFARSGFAGASVDEIAESAGYSKGAFYSNFESKEDAFLLLLEQHLDDEIARGRYATSSNEFQEAIEKFVNLYAMEKEDRDWCLLSVEFSLHAVRSDKFGKHYSKLYHRYYEQIAETLTQLAQLTGGRLDNAYLSASKFVAFRNGLALDLAAKSPTLTRDDVKQALRSFLRKVIRISS